MPYKCNICNKEFLSYSGFWKHNKKYHQCILNKIPQNPTIIPQNSTHINLQETLNNSYQINIDYTINKTKSNGKKGAPPEEILLTVKCFKLLCMQSKTFKKILKIIF